MSSTQTLAHMTNARMLLFHPGIDYRLKRGHAISALSAIKALEPVHASYPFGFEIELVLFRPPLLTCIAYCIMLTFILPYRYRYLRPHTFSSWYFSLCTTFVTAKSHIHTSSA